jgi:DNA-binding NarL/FixJ family response regulator
MSAESQSVLLVEDDAMVSGWVRMALEGSEFRIAGVAASAAEAMELAGRRHADVLLIDYRLPDGRGTELVRDLRRTGIAVPAVLMTANTERGFNEAAREAGAQGTTLKTGSTDELVSALRLVLDGLDAFDARHPARAPGRGALSPREREVLRLVADGNTNQEIAGKLGVGGETVKTLIARTFAKLGVRRRAEAVAAAHDRGLL